MGVLGGMKVFDGLLSKSIVDMYPVFFLHPIYLLRVLCFIRNVKRDET